MKFVKIFEKSVPGVHPVVPQKRLNTIENHRKNNCFKVLGVTSRRLLPETKL